MKGMLMTSNQVKILEAEYILLRPGKVATNTAVVVQHGKIVSVGDSAALKAQWPNAEKHSFGDAILMPGLINGHQHGRGLSQVQLGYHDDYLEPWIAGRRSRGLLDGATVTKLAAARMLANGVTTTIHANYTYGTGDYEGELRSQMEAYKSLGIRHTMCVGVMDRGQLVYPPHEACFMAGLPDATKDWLSRPGASPYCTDGPTTVDLMKQLRLDYSDTSLVQLCYGPAGPQWVSDEMWKLISDDANENGIGMHMHAMESPAQRDAAAELFPEGVFQYLKNLGALNERTVLAHAVWVSDQDIELLAESGVSVVRNPGCNIRMRNGIAPLAKYLAAGVPVAIGTDNCSMQDDEDLLSELRLAGNLGREPDWNGPPPPSVDDMVRMATTFGAKAAQFEGVIGALDEGMRADIAVFSLARTRQPYLDTDMPIMEAFLARGAGSDTVMTMVDGGNFVSAWGIYARRYRGLRAGSCRRGTKCSLAGGYGQY